MAAKRFTLESDDEQGRKIQQIVWRLCKSAVSWWQEQVSSEDERVYSKPLTTEKFFQRREEKFTPESCMIILFGDL